MSFYIGLSVMSNLRVPENDGLSRTQVQTREGRRILRLLDEGFGLSGETIKLEDRPIHIESGGRPFFVDHHADFSISHSHRMAAVAFSANRVGGGPPCRVGCDIQRRLPFHHRDKISERFFHPPERRYMTMPSDIEEQELRFCKLWVLKEAYLKMKGLSVFDMAGTPCFVSGEESETADVSEGETSPFINFYLYEWGDPPEQYLMAVCREAEGGEPEIRWYSQSTLPLKNREMIKTVPGPEKEGETIAFCTG
jgi:phosphopantetheinyl transferase